jgi:prepilin-type N-terminal cleavage/methylation domain-containing protein
LKKLRTIKLSKNSGFTLIEIVIGLGIFAILASAALASFTILARTTQGAREKTVLSSLSSQYLEIVRNLPYSQVGTVNGNPAGSLPDLSNAFTSTIENQQYKIYYEVTYIDDPADGTVLAGTDAAANDYKQVKMLIQKVSTGQITTFLTNVSPQGLEGLSNAGALLIKSFNASGQPVANANVHIESTNLTPQIVLDRQTDSTGNWVEVGLPISANGYHIVVTKSGYSTDQTYPLSAGNPNPIKPDATIINGQVTQVSFSIDLVSTLTIQTLNQTCQNVSGVNLNIKGAKLIGTSPDVLKFDQNFTSAAGRINMTNAEWDTYVPLVIPGAYTVYGTSPIQQINVLPGTTPGYTVILGPLSAHSLLVIVKDAASGTALEGATVHLRKGGGTPEDFYATTGGSVWRQLDWTGGLGQADFVDTTRYFLDDGNINTSTLPTAVRLTNSGSGYSASGWLESSSFDTGASSNFTTISWDPPSQHPATTLKFQIASNNDNATWNYVGPDATPATFYSTPGTSISPVHDSNRYVRYKVFLETTDSAQTPVLTGMSINYVSGCFTPGQVIFPNLTAGNNYDLDVTMPGYQPHTDNNLNINGNQPWEVLMTP